MLLALFGCERGDNTPVIVIDGSSTVSPLTKAVAQSFEKREPVKVDVKTPLQLDLGISGTSGGFRRLCGKLVAIANASRPITTSEKQECAANGVEFVELPVAYDGLAVVVNPENTWASSITTEELKTIWAPAAEGVVTKWSQVRPDWPDADLHLFGAGKDSGTFDYFTEAIVHKNDAIRKDYTASENDDELVEGVANDKNALGFFGYAYVYKNQERLKVVPVDDGNPENGAGPILPTPENVRNGSYQPLSRPLFIYVSKTALQRREVELFVSYYLMNAAKFARRIGYVDLPEKAYILAQRRVTARKVGSLFERNDARIGLSIERLLEKEQVADR